jgi:hypothetical protein
VLGLSAKTWKKESSFSEEKEAKRLSFLLPALAAERVFAPIPAARMNVIWFFFQERTLF